MKRKPIALVLGGTAPHIALIEELRRRGYKIVLADYYDNPPAKFAADAHVRESTLDQEKILSVARHLPAALVISICVDQANRTACYVAEKLGLPAPYSYETALAVTNKGLMKKTMVNAGIHTARYLSLHTANDLDAFGLTFPVMIKPADSCGSAGVRKVDNVETGRRAVDDAIRISRSGSAIIEEFRPGTEFSVYAYYLNGKAHILLIAHRLSIEDGNGRVLKCYATVAPASLSSVIMPKIQDAADMIGRTFKLKNTPLHVQVIVDGSEVSVIEFAPRIGGGMSYATIHKATGFNMIAAGVDSYLGVAPEVEYTAPSRIHVSHLVYANPGKFCRVSGVDALVAEGVIESFHAYKTIGMMIGSERANSARIGAFLVSSSSISELANRIDVAFNRMEIFGESGDKLMRRDLRASAIIRQYNLHQCKRTERRVVHEPGFGRVC